jgi:hypothetical protein
MNFLAFFSPCFYFVLCSYVSDWLVGGFNHLSPVIFPLT